MLHIDGGCVALDEELLLVVACGIAMCHALLVGVVIHYILLGEAVAQAQFLAVARHIIMTRHIDGHLIVDGEHVGLKLTGLSIGIDGNGVTFIYRSRFVFVVKVCNTLLHSALYQGLVGSSCRHHV